MAEIIVGLIMIAFGSVITIKSESIFKFTGRIRWAEQHLGFEGGTRIFIKLIGIGLIVVGIFVGTGTFGSLIGGIFNRGGIPQG